MCNLSEEKRTNLISLIEKVNNPVIRLKFINSLTIEDVIEVAVNEEDPDVVYAIREKLEKEIDKDEVKKNIFKLAKAKDCQIRSLSIEFLSGNELIEMAVNEENDDVVNAILKRLEMDIAFLEDYRGDIDDGILKRSKDIEEVKKNIPKLANAKHQKIRAFSIRFLPTNNFIEMLLNEECSNLVYMIFEIFIKRNTEWLKENAYKLIKAKSWIVRHSIVKFLVKGELIEMLENEENFEIIYAIFEKLKNEEGMEELRKNAYKLTKSENWDIRKAVIEFLSTEKLIEMAVDEENVNVVNAILSKLNEEKDTEEIEKNAYKLAKSKAQTFRRFATDFLSGDDLIEIAKIEEDICVVNAILSKLKEEKNIELVKKNAINLARAKDFEIQTLAIEFLELDTLSEVAEEGEEKEIVEKIIGMLN